MEVILQEVKTESQPQVIVPDLEGSDVHNSHSLSKITLGKIKTNTIITTSKNNSPAPVSIQSQKISTIQQHHSTVSSHLINSTPVRIATLSGQQLQTMAKSSGLSVVHVTGPQTVIQSPSSVIQSAAGQLLSKNLILVSSKNNSVIQTTGGAIQAVQVLQAHPNSEDEESLSNDGVISPENIRTADKKRREILTRRPSYRKILNDLGGADSTEITGDKADSATTSESSQDADGALVLGQGQYPAVKVINANTLGLGQATTAEGSGVPAAALQTITMTNAGTAGGTIVQYAHQDGQQFFVPVGSEIQAYTIRPVSSASSSPGVMSSGGMGGHSGTGEEATRKREIRLLKNREAARECRRKKKEYIKCLENRVAVLENQNKALIDELKSLKELYCQQKND